MNTTLLLGILALVYGLSVIGHHALAMHTMRSWHAGYWTARPVSVLAGWHPILAAECFARGIPRCAPTEAQWRNFYVVSALPGLNTVVVLFVLAEAAIETVVAKLSQPSTPVEESPIQRRLFG